MAKRGKRVSSIRGSSGITLTEQVLSRDLTDTSGRVTLDFVYILRGTSSEMIAYNYLLDHTPRVYENLFRMEVNVKPILVDEIKDTGDWRCTVRYGTGDLVPRDLMDSSFSFDTTGGSQHLTISRETITSSAVDVDGNTTDAPDRQGAIGVSIGGSGAVEGVDIPSPVYNFSESHIFPDRAVDLAYRGILFGMTGRINTSPFKGFKVGECLFLGAVGHRRGLGDWVVSFRFAASPDEVNRKVGRMTLLYKRGWDYLWVVYGTVISENAFVDVPIAAYDERIFLEGDFGALGIGT